MILNLFLKEICIYQLSSAKSRFAQMFIYMRLYICKFYFVFTYFFKYINYQLVHNLVNEKYMSASIQ